MHIKLWSINSILRWTGFRLVVTVDRENQVTTLGLKFYGWQFIRTITW